MIFTSTIPFLFLASPSRPSPPPPTLFPFPKEESRKKTHTLIQNIRAGQPEIIHLDICACVPLEGGIGQRESGKKGEI